MANVVEGIKSSFSFIVIACSFIGFLFIIYDRFNLAIDEVGTILGVVGVGVMIKALYDIGIKLDEMENSVEDRLRGIENILTSNSKIKTKSNTSNPKNSSNPSNPSNKKEKEEVETSGVGALGGALVGSAVGLAFGPVGVLIAGIIGTLLGNQIEYENQLDEKKRKREKKTRI